MGVIMIERVSRGRFLDVCRNPDAEGCDDHAVPFLLVVQSDLIQVQHSRVVIPLVRARQACTPIDRLMPAFEVEGERVIMMTPQILASLQPRSALSSPVLPNIGSISGRRSTS